MENTKETKGKEKATPRYNGEQKTIRKLPQVDVTARSETTHNFDGAVLGVNSADSFREKDSQENIQESEAKERSSGSVAYISETLIMQITKEQKLDLIKSLTIHLPKDKMNKKIKYIENLEKLKRLQSLNLSNNMIEKMQKLESLVELRELNLANNCLKVIECLDNFVKLHVLNLGGNQITSIPGTAIKKLRCLKVLKLSHNKLETLLDITRLRPLQDLTNLDLQGNPFTSLPHYRQFVIFQLRSLDVLDNQIITKEERLMADQRFAQEEVRRLEAEISKQEKLYQNVENEKNEAKVMVENLTKTQNTLKAKVSKQTDRVRELEQNIEAKNGLLKAKNSDLIKASEKQYRVEQELAFYKLDAKFEMLGQMPLPEDSQVDEDDGLEDSSYIGKATYKRNRFIQESNTGNANPERVAHMRSLRMKYEEDEKMRDRLDKELQEKKQMIMQLEEHLEQLSQDVEEKNDQLQDTSEKLASLELSLASQMASLGQGNDLAKKQLAEKIEFIKRLQAAAEELEERMKVVANDVEEKQKELEELRRKAAETDNGDDAQSNLHQALNSKQAELQDTYAQLSKMKEDLEILKNRIAEEQAQVEMLREQLGRGESMSEKAMNQLKKELEGVTGGLNKRLGELQNLARKQQARIRDLEKERDLLEDELTKRNNMEGNVDLLQQQLNEAERALEDEKEKSGELEERERELQGRLSALDKNNNLELIEARSKLRLANEENERKLKKLKDQIENERKAAKDRVERDEVRVAKALEAARKGVEKEKEMKGLALQVDALKATNEALNDRLEEAEDELRNREKRDSVGKDQLLQRLEDLLNDVEEGKKEVKQPLDHTDGVGQYLADLHKKYLELAEELEQEKENGKHKQKQAKAAIDTLKAELAQCQSQLNAAERALAQLSKDGTEHGEDMKSLEDNVYRLQEGLRSALDKAEDQARKRKRDAKAYEEKIQALEDEIGRLQDELNEEHEQEANELNHVRSLVGKQKDHLENEIRELQNELRKLKDKHRQELKRKNGNVAELEALLSEKDELLSEEKNKKANALERELEELRRLVSDQTKVTQDSINKEIETKRVHRKLEDTRRKIDGELKTAENKVHRLEQLLDNKDQQIQASRRRGFELDDTITALTGELEALKKTMARRGHDFDELASAVGRIDDNKEKDEVARTKIHHHIYNHNTPVNQGVQTVHQHHIDNTSPLLHHQTREHTISLEVSPPSGIDQIHHHHHYGNGDFTLDLKKRKSRKKDLCNVLEHEDLEDDVMVLEEELARANSELSSQKTENKMNVLRSDLQVLEQTVSESVQHRTPVKGLESQLDETLARFQDHLLTLMDHRTTLLSQKK